MIVSTCIMVTLNVKVCLLKLQVFILMMRSQMLKSTSTNKCFRSIFNCSYKLMHLTNVNMESYCKELTINISFIIIKI